ncbi:MAG: carboxypeptidase regulatory-like domain-containing protein [Gammaproteobacteria bacterium]|nr:carboxypeptidase regulatory-like domain-containing protein [Gammaproteobacteria bacterium]MBU2183068.1 carboxypeptidase regulatory-like domain-containing protein [Gammaproteobacteria bacterium]MBU2203172.1 carboxypeptidase regulatory-like domain-containing protein [Gammaproteobacteria bacterium]
MKIKSIALAVTLALGVSNIALAQETSSAVRGVVTTEAGTTVTNATVRITDKRNGTTRTLTTNETGTFSARGLQVGGPYLLTVVGPEGRTETIDNVFLTLGDTQNLNVVIQQPDVERIAVTGSSISNSAYGSKSPVANFNLSDLQTIPSVNRDISDVVAADPRIYIDAGFARGIQCNGANPRFNSLTVDGVKMNDNFGLNSNGYPTERMPFSYDALEQVSVEFAPFDVKYGGFTACNINAVTKSGTNEFKGTVFFDYTNQDMIGDELEGMKIDRDDFNKKNYGLNVGGALVKDKLFWFAAYEKYEGADNFSRGPQDGNAGTPVSGLNQADIDRIAQIARDVYGYEVGSPITSSPVEDEKLLVKLDWYINDMHRAALTYNYNDGGSVRESDTFTGAYEFSDHYYDRGAEFTSYVAQFFSDWTDNFSTEVRAGYSELDNRQQNIGPGGLGEVQIRVNAATVFLGVDDSRQSNKLSYDTTFLKLAGTYSVGDHLIYAGYEFEEYNVFNMFVQHSIGEYRFNNINAFEAGQPARIYYGSGAGTNDPTNAAASFGYENHTLYAQDEYYIYDLDMTVTFGLRYDWYSSSDKPRVNQNFVNRYGFANDATFDGEGLIQPRLGINWNVNDELELRGGIGLYSGGNPNVWLANGYQNDGITQIQIEDRSPANVLNTPLSGAGRPLYDIPQKYFDQVANATGDSAVNAVDPSFKLPSEWKYAFGGTYSFESGYIVMADLMYSVGQNQSIVKDLALEQVDTLFDGRPVYERVGGRSGEYLLTNASEDAKTLSFSTSVSKDFDNGLKMQLAYAYIDAEDSNPMGSSVAGSNFGNYARSDLNDPRPATSNYETPHRFTFRATYKHEFVDGYETTIALLGSHNKGRPYSYTFGGNIAGDTSSDRQLLYVPTGADDPNVVWGANDDGVPFNQDAFFTFVDAEGLPRGQIVERNADYSDWWTKFDLRITQDLPGFVQGHKAKAFFVIDNLTNLLNDDWGVMYEAGFPQTVSVVDATVNANGQYEFNEFTSSNPQARVANPSYWSMKIGVEYRF